MWWWVTPWKHYPQLKGRRVPSVSPLGTLSPSSGIITVMAGCG